MVFIRSAARHLRRPASSLLKGPSVAAPIGARTLTASASRQGKVLMCLYQGHEHARQQPGLLGTTENELGLRKWLESQGHTLVTTADKEGPNSTFEKELVDAEVIITTP